MSALKLISLPALAFILGIGHQLNALAETNAPVVQAVPADEASKQSAGLESLTEENTFLPTGDLFRPLLADPKEPRFYLSFRVFRFRSDKTNAAVGGFGEIFGLYRHTNTTGGYSWQSSFGGGIHAQFDLRAPSMDLVNTDYTIGFPFSFRKDAASYRITLYHQSSHLGDEFLLRNNIDRLELSYESVDATGSYEWEKWRVYYGGEYLVHKEPRNLKPLAAHWGIEYYDTKSIIGRGRLVAGWDLKSDEEHDWSLNSSVKVGLQFDASTPNGRYIRVLAEGYQGFTPYGQFYTTRSAYAGVGIYLGFE